jgi:hypothetical protein
MLMLNAPGSDKCQRPIRYYPNLVFDLQPIVLRLDRSLKNIFIDPPLLRSQSNLRANILEAIFLQKRYVNEDAQKFREHLVQLMIFELARVAKLSLWDIEAPLSRQSLAGLSFREYSLLCQESFGFWGERAAWGYRSTVLNSMGVHDSRELEGSITDFSY